MSAIIRKTQKVKNGKTHAYYIIEYFLTGKRKQVWKSNLGEAEAHAREACIKIGNGNQAALDLADRDRLIYLRANDALAGLGVPGRSPA